MSERLWIRGQMRARSTVDDRPLTSLPVLPLTSLPFPREQV